MVLLIPRPVQSLRVWALSEIRFRPSLCLQTFIIVLSLLIGHPLSSAVALAKADASYELAAVSRNLCHNSLRPKADVQTIDVGCRKLFASLLFLVALMSSPCSVVSFVMNSILLPSFFQGGADTFEKDINLSGWSEFVINCCPKTLVFPLPAIASRRREFSRPRRDNRARTAFQPENVTERYRFRIMVNCWTNTDDTDRNFSYPLLKFVEFSMPWWPNSGVGEV